MTEGSIKINIMLSNRMIKLVYLNIYETGQIYEVKSVIAAWSTRRIYLVFAFKKKQRLNLNLMNEARTWPGSFEDVLDCYYTKFLFCPDGQH